MFIFAAVLDLFRCSYTYVLSPTCVLYQNDINKAL